MDAEAAVGWAGLGSDGMANLAGMDDVVEIVPHVERPEGVGE